MGLISWIKNKIAGTDRAESAVSENEDSIPEIVMPDRAGINMSDPAMRERYVRNCCEQMIESTKEIDSATKEYRLVTDYLKDMEEIDAVPEPQATMLTKSAEKLISLENDRSVHNEKIGKISESKYEQMERVADDMPAAVDKIREEEEYRVLVKEDLQKLEGEKATYNYEKQMLTDKKAGCRSLVYITVFAVIFTMIALLVFQFALELDTTIGYLVTAGAAAIALTVIFTCFTNASYELKRVNNFLNQIIAKQNTVKIRYVNSTNVLEYEYVKYHVNSSDELKYNWDLYNTEKTERELLDETGSELAHAQSEYMKLLRSIRIKYPGIWLHQAYALVDRREMVEIRHDLVARRQSLRKRIDYNTENRNLAKEEINDLVKKYPNYGKEILAIVSAYE